MISHPKSNRRKFLLLCLLQYLRLSSSRDWTDCVDPSTLLNDGMPRIPPPRNKTKDYQSVAASATNAMSHMMAERIEIEMHGSDAALFEEADPFRFTAEPSSAPSSVPTSAPSGVPSSLPSGAPSDTPTTSFPPTNYPTAKPTNEPTIRPTFSIATIPSNPKSGYFNYDNDSNSDEYGPSKWKNINAIQEEDPGYFWHTFDLEERVTNDCSSGKKQSPINVCQKPKESCTEMHEMRPKSGDYKMDSTFITKQILPNKLRLIMTPRTGEEPDPPQIDFSSNGRGIIDMTNIDFKFPSEHTVCGHRFDGEMQYFTYHPARKRFVAVSFFLDASETNPRNEHLQEVIEAFKVEYKEDERKCKAKQEAANSSFASNFASGSSANSFVSSQSSNSKPDPSSVSSSNSVAPIPATRLDSSSSASSFASTFASGGGRKLLDEHDNYVESADDYSIWNTTILDDDDDDEENSGLRSKSRHRRLALKWHPFHPDIQKSVHFWGYTGSFTEPPCTDDKVDWKIMDVPTPISPRQLEQFKALLFGHVDENCVRTSVHNSQGSVARPTQDQLKYYKCTRDDYVSDEERAVCGDEGCVNPFGAGLNRYYAPLVHVTGPPTRSPSN